MISVVIPARNAEDTLGIQIEAVLAQEVDAPIELIVVDSASTDSTAALASSYPGVRVIGLDVPGANRARNAGIAASRGDLVLLCDADDVVLPGWAAALFEASAEADYLGGTLAFTALNDARCRVRWGLRTVSRRGDTLDPLPAPMSCNCGFRRSLWQAVGGFDERLLTGNDDYEFFWRASHAGYSYQNVPEAVIEYRLRDRPSTILAREFKYGRADTKVQSISRSYGRRPDPIAKVVRVWCWVVKEAVLGLVSRHHRWAALRIGARRLGRLVESARSRIWFP